MPGGPRRGELDPCRDELAAIFVPVNAANAKNACILETSSSPAAASKPKSKSTTTTATLPSQFRTTASHADKRREGGSATTREANDRAIRFSTPSQVLNSPSPTCQPPEQSGRLPYDHAAVGGPSSWSVKKILGAASSSAPVKPPQTFNPLPFPATIRRPSASRLWNPSNSTPRLAQAPVVLPPTIRDLPPRAVPLSHPQLSPSHNHRQTERPDSYPLLTLPELHAKRNSANQRTSLQIDISSSPSPRISLPGSVSIELSRKTPSPLGLSDSPDSPTEKQEEKKKPTAYHKRGQSVSNPTADPRVKDFGAKVDYKGKGVDRADFQAMETNTSIATNTADADIEPGIHHHPYPPARSGFPNINSNASAESLSRTSAIDPALNSPALTNASSSAIGSENGEDVVGTEEAWGPSHPCYPHLNPHVPTTSSLYRTTRIIRIRRDWLLEGDLAPTFSNLYPEILDPAGLSEQEFRKLISHVNTELVPAFNPFAWRNILDSVLGLLTGWIWDDLGATGIKNRLQRVEAWLEDWNMRMEKGFGEGEAVRIVPLRRTGYMNLDIQIPDPVINSGEDQSEARGPARTNE